MIVRTLDFKTHGTCSRMIHVEVDDDNKIHNVKFQGGCPGNTLGLSHLIEGLDADFVIDRLKGTKCLRKDTSCPDQLAKALEEILHN